MYLPLTSTCSLCVQENGKNRLQQAQKEVEEVKVIMLDNLNKADERSGKLGELENRADELLEKVIEVYGCVPNGALFSESSGQKLCTISGIRCHLGSTLDVLIDVFNGTKS